MLNFAVYVGGSRKLVAKMHIHACLGSGEGPVKLCYTAILHPLLNDGTKFAFTPGHSGNSYPKYWSIPI